jgi:hypothetical protein
LLSVSAIGRNFSISILLSVCTYCTVFRFSYTDVSDILPALLLYSPDDSLPAPLFTCTECSPVPPSTRLSCCAVRGCMAGWSCCGLLLVLATMDHLMLGLHAAADFLLVKIETKAANTTQFRQRSASATTPQSGRNKERRHVVFTESHQRRTYSTLNLRKRSPFFSTIGQILPRAGILVVIP